MSSAGDVTALIERLKGGDRGAVQPLLERYFHRLVGLARLKLKGARHPDQDEEDVALSAFDSFCRAAERGRFPRLDDRDDLWQLLALLTCRKAADVIERWKRFIRAAECGESALGAPADGAGGERPIEQVVGREPTPEEAAEVAEGYRRLVGLLEDERLRNIANWKLEGYTNAEIAQKLGRAVVTVEQNLKLIRAIWTRHGVG
jgi:DNA-directed RNA polymerase specialized sigma24 family protein